MTLLARLSYLWLGRADRPGITPVTNFLIVLLMLALGGVAAGGWSMFGLARTVGTCSKSSSADPEKVAFYAWGALATLAMVDYPVATSFVTPLPAEKCIL